MARRGWHKSDIKAALEKRGLSLSDLDRAGQLPEGTCSATLRKPHALGELTIAEALGRSPRELWPSRYNPGGARKRPQPTENYSPAPMAGHRQKEWRA